MNDPAHTAHGSLRFRPTPKYAIEIVQRLARESRNVAWSTHALARMLERDITDEIALDVLRNGHLMGDIDQGRNPGEWKVKVGKQIKGRRQVGVVVLIIRESRLLVKTVEWEDANV
jgi:hypothetical protein